METSNLTLAYIVAELKPILEGAFLNSVQQLKESVLKIKFHNKTQGTIELIATPNALYKTHYKTQAMENQTGFAAFLKKQLYNKRLLALEQHGFDRIIEMKFAELDLIFELFAQGNIILKDKAGKIVSCYHNEQWKDRETKRGAQYNYPTTKKTILETTEPEFAKALKESSQDTVRAIVSMLNVAPIAAEEACALSSIEKTKKAQELTEKQTKALHKELMAIYSIETKKAKPVILEEKGNNQLLPFVFFSLPKEKQTQVQSLNEALDEELSTKMQTTEIAEAKKETDKKKSKLLYSQTEQLKARERFEKEEKENKEKAELLYLHYSEIKELQDAIKKALEQKINKKDIMYKLKSAAKKGNKSALLFVDFDPKTKKIVLELPGKKA